MIKFNLYETFELGEIAEIERAKKDKLYPKGSTLIQISATKGEVFILKEKSIVDTKYAVIIPIAGVNHKYLNIVIDMSIDKFLNKYKTGLNIQFEDIRKMEVYLHDIDTQKAVVNIIEHIEKEMEIVSKEIETYNNIKNTMLSKMLI